jgi:hypothetical protein
VTLSGEVGQGELTARIVSLRPGETLTIAEFCADELTRWQVRIDRQGTPRVGREPASWASLRREGELSEAKVAQFLAPGDERQLLTAAPKEADRSPELNEAQRMVHRRYGAASPLRLDGASVDERLGEATRQVPLSQWYALYVLEPGPSGRLDSSPQQLFRPGDRRGAAASLRIRCAPGGRDGTTFAVLAHDGHDYTGLVSMASAQVPPGSYTVTATLRRPGRVSFDGLGVKLHKDPRNWADVRATVPPRLDVPQAGRPEHLIVAVETCGQKDQVAAHLDRAAQLVGNLADDAECSARYSLLSYGAHPHNLRVTDDPVAVLAWAEGSDVVLAQLMQLREQAGTRPDHYSRAAKVECMLHQVVSLLRDGHGRARARAPRGRQALVTVGTRSPFPPWIDPVTEIVPCPAHHDWHDGLASLKQSHEMAFGAICGGDREDAAWSLLGANASADLVVLDSRRFAAELGFLDQARPRIPFPLVDR